jgi:hypothetical protein
MSIDPTNGCQFWYTNEFYNPSSLSNWKTAVGAFTVPSCDKDDENSDDREQSDRSENHGAEDCHQTGGGRRHAGAPWYDQSGDRGVAVEGEDDCQVSRYRLSGHRLDGACTRFAEKQARC